jgi:MFS family permease
MFFTGLSFSQIAPVLPLYIMQLGVHDPGSVTILAGAAYGINFIVSACVAPAWGAAADRFGRKPMLLRASFGMGVFTFLIGFAPNVAVLIILRGALGLLAGFGPACTTLIATQTPKQRLGYAMGMLTTARTAGQLLGPIIGGGIEMIWGLRPVFWITGSLVMISFLTSLVCVKEDFKKPPAHFSWGAAAELAHHLDKGQMPSRWSRRRLALSQPGVWKLVPQRGLTVLLLACNAIICIALFSAQPILSLYIAGLPDPHLLGSTALTSGIIFSASGLASIVASPVLGNVSDRKGPHKVILLCLIVAVLVYLGQAFVGAAWQLLILNFFAGLTNGGLSPSVQTMIAKITPRELSGRIFGYQQSTRNIGVALGALVGGQIGAAFGINKVFLIVAGVLALNVIFVYFMIYRKLSRSRGHLKSPASQPGDFKCPR